MPRQASSPTFHQPPHDVQHVQCPSTLRGFDFADGFEPGVTGANFLRRNDDRSSRRESALTFPAFSRRNWSGLTSLRPKATTRQASATTSDDNCNPGFGRDAVQVYVAAHPPCPARGRRERLSVFATLRRDEPLDDS